MRTRSQTKKLMTSDATKFTLENCATLVPKLNMDIMGIIRSKLDKMTTEKAYKYLREKVSENCNSSNEIIGEETEIGLLTNDISMSNMDFTILHQTISARRLYIDIVTLQDFCIETETSEGIPYFSYICFPEDDEGTKQFSYIFEWRVFDGYIIKQPNARYLSSKRFSTFWLEMQTEILADEHEEQIEKIQGQLQRCKKLLSQYRRKCIQRYGF